jgi:hypothetical protein
VTYFDCGFFDDFPRKVFSKITKGVIRLSGGGKSRSSEKPQ